MRFDKIKTHRIDLTEEEIFFLSNLIRPKIQSKRLGSKDYERILNSVHTKISLHWMK